MIRSALTVLALAGVAGTAHAYLPGAPIQPTGWSLITSKSDSKNIDSSYGDWGAGYSLYGRVYYAKDWTTTSINNGDSVTTEGKLKAWGKAFGNKADLVELRGNGTSTVGGSRRYDARVFGRSLIFGYWMEYPGESTTSSVVSLGDSVMLQFAQAEARFWYVLTARAKGSVNVGYSASGTMSGANVNTTYRPYAKVVGWLSLSLDAIVAEAGVYGEIDLVDASLPITLKSTPNTSNLAAVGECIRDVTLSSNLSLTLRFLYGEVGLFARWPFGDKRWELVDWSGIKTTYTLDNRTLPVCF